MRQILPGTGEGGSIFKRLRVHQKLPLPLAVSITPTYNIQMNDAIESIEPPGSADNLDLAYDLMRGVATYTASPVVNGLVRVLARHPEAEIGVAFNPKQVACKLWARDCLYTTLGGEFNRIWIVGGWYAIFAAMLLDDPRFLTKRIESFDLDPAVGDVASTLMSEWGAAFSAHTQNMYDLDYAAASPDLVVNTSCEHIVDLRGWLDLLPGGTNVLLQSNDYFAEPQHVGCAANLTEFAASAGLREVIYSGSLPQKKYTRFMLIGRV
jgi:hypothetical protein